MINFETYWNWNILEWYYPFNPYSMASESPGTRMRGKARGDGNHRVLDPEVSSAVKSAKTWRNVKQFSPFLQRISAVNRFQLSAKLSKCQDIQQNSPEFLEERSSSSSIHPFHRFNSADYDRLCNAKASGREHVIRHGHRFSVQLPTVRAILGVRMLVPSWSWRCEKKFLPSSSTFTLW